MSKYYKAEDIIDFLNVYCPKDMWEYQIADIPTIEVSEDCISRSALLKEVKMDIEDDGLQEKMIFYRIKNAPSVVPTGYNLQPVEDCISREYIVEKLKASKEFYLSAWGSFSNMDDKDKARCDELNNCIATVINAPSVVPKERIAE